MQEKSNRDLELELIETRREVRRLRAELEALKAPREHDLKTRSGPVSMLDWMAVY